MTIASPLGYVVDASIIVARFVFSDAHHDNVLDHWNHLETGQTRFHIPTLAIVETAGVIFRRISLSAMAAAAARLRQYTELGYIVQYPLDDYRKNQAVSMVVAYNLLGADAVYCALAEELELQLLTADKDFEGYPRATILP